MVANVCLNEELVERAFLLSGEATREAAVTCALQEFIARREQKHIVDIFGTLDWEPAFDYKSERSRDV